MNKKTIVFAITAAMLVSLLPSEPGAGSKKKEKTNNAETDYGECWKEQDNKNNE